MEADGCAASTTSKLDRPPHAACLQQNHFTCHMHLQSCLLRSCRILHPQKTCYIPEADLYSDSPCLPYITAQNVVHCIMPSCQSPTLCLQRSWVPTLFPITAHQIKANAAAATSSVFIRRSSKEASLYYLHRMFYAALTLNPTTNH